MLKRADADDDHMPPRQAREVHQRYVLKIDSQAKKSFDDRDAAVKAGKEIKKKYPVVKAAVYDSQEGSNESC
jgi:hypothetical protein